MTKQHPAKRNAIEIREQDTISIIAALREKGFTEAPFNQSTKDRVFKKEGMQPFLINVRDAKVSYGNLAWLGTNYGNSISFIKNLM